MTKQPTLSISLLTPGKDETLWKCLDSLKKIQKQVDTEIVIVDTGCSEEVHNRLHEYTDKIVKFIWCNDFAKARNAGLEQCTGEWFMFIDDDEWFEDVTPLVDFFECGIYKKYECANYAIRSYRTMEGKDYDDAWITRLARKTDSLRFEGTIHEHLDGYVEPSAIIKAYAEHYGYVTDDQTKSIQKSRRNILLLENVLESKPDDIRAMAHLIAEYLKLNEYRMAEMTSSRMYEVYKRDGIIDILYIGAMYSALLLYPLEILDYEEVIARYEEYILDDNNSKFGAAMIEDYAIEAYFFNGDYDKCIKTCDLYLNLFDKYADDVNEQAKSGIFTYQAFTYEEDVKLFRFLSYIGLGKLDKAQKEFKNLEFEKATRLDCTIDKMLDLMVIHDCEWMTDILSIPRIASTMAANITDLRTKDKSEYIKYSTFGAKLNLPLTWVSISKIDIADNKKDLEDAFESLFKASKDILSTPVDIWEKAESYDIDLSEFVNIISYDNWKESIDSFFDKKGEKKLPNFLLSTEDKDGLNYEYLHLKEMEEYIIDRCGDENNLSGQISYSDIRALMGDFIDKALSLYGKFYTDYAFSGQMEMLPAICRIAVKWSELLSCDEYNVSEVKNRLTECIGVYQSFDDIIKLYTKLYSEWIQNNYTPQNEMEVLANQIKSKIIELIEIGQLETANQMLNQLKSLTPNDEELEVLGSKITNISI